MGRARSRAARRHRHHRHCRNARGCRSRLSRLALSAGALGWPLRPLEGGYRELVSEHRLQVGGLITGWNPLSHDGYWSGDEVLDALVGQLRRALLAGGAAPNAAADYRA